MGIGPAIMLAINSLFNIVYVLILVRVFSSWLPFLYDNSVFSKLLYMIESLTEPIMAPVRNLLNKTQMGQLPVDFSPVIVLLLLQFIQGALLVVMRSVFL